MKKHEWRKKEKDIYLPKNTPEVITIPPFKFLTISGAGNPNSPHFSDYITVLYSISYAIKMTLKKTNDLPLGYYDYTVYPLEGIWDINDEAKKNYSGKLNKDDLVFNLMIRQPDFVSIDYFNAILKGVKIKKPNVLLDEVKFQTLEEGQCIQMLHVGSYDSEPESFKKMEEFAHKNGLSRKSKIHREIYLSDFRKVAPEKLKTILRFSV